MQRSFASIIRLWPSFVALAGDLNRARPRAVKAATPGGVRKWAERDAVPAEWWLALVEAAQQRGLDGVRLDELAAMAADRSGRAA